MMIRTLAQLRNGQTGIVQEVRKNGRGMRLMEIGFTKGIPVRCCRCAPLGDPVQVILRGRALAIRRAEAELIFVEI